MFGLIAKNLKHSFSKEIHEELFSDEYKLIELKESILPIFLKKKEFKGINVTVPYKETVIPYLDQIDDIALKIGSVNTIINKNNKLIGYNTDYYGFSDLLSINNIDVFDKNVLVLGSGGTAKTIQVYLKEKKAQHFDVVSSTNKENTISYEEAKTKIHTQIIINATPVGMYPNNDSQIISLSSFPCLVAVIDVIYNPLCTPLVLEAKEKKIKYVSGLYMLVSQAYYSSELFHDTKIDKAKIQDIYRKIKKEKQNVVFIGMPSCGKTTFAKLISEQFHKQYLDSDEIFFEKTGLTPEQFITNNGEQAFRDLEKEIVKELAIKQNKVIATGGGVILEKENIFRLKQNGVLVFLDRPLEKLETTDDRPLSNTFFKLKDLYEKRYQLYINASDIIIKNDGSIQNTLEKIIKEYTLYEKDSYC